VADIKWYSMVPGLPRMLPEVCNGEATPGTVAWLERMGERPAVRQLESFRPAGQTDTGRVLFEKRGRQIVYHSCNSALRTAWNRLPDGTLPR